MAESDLVVIGAGPGGYVAAIRAAQLGLRTTVVERDRPGGVCGNWGCIPSKALLADAALFVEMQGAAKRGLVVDGLRADFGRVVDRSRQVADTQAKGVEFLFKKNGIAYVHGVAKLVPGGVEVSRDDGKKERVQAKHVLLATGSAERTLPGLEVDGTVVMTSREVLECRELPATCVVVGGGAIGVEFAYVYASFGCKVTVVEMAETLLPGMDVDLGRELARAFAKQKIDVLTGHRYEGCKRRDGGATITVKGPQGTRALGAERVLVAVGRGPEPKDELGLERLGVKREHGFVVVDATMRTSVPNVYAIGDLVGPYLLAHTASDQGLIAVETIAGRPTHPMDPTRVPLCIYCEPEVAAVGLTESQAREGGRGVKVGKFPFRALGKALAAGHTDGFVKLVAGEKHGEVLGVHMIGVGVTDLIAEGGLARTLEATTEELIATVHAHPTLAEAIREAALVAEGRGINV